MNTDLKPKTLKLKTLKLGTLKPGTFVRLKNQPADLPDFVLERALGDTCWIRQQTWGIWVKWTVKTSRIDPGCATISSSLRLEIS
jgi:hypothetical protein